MTNDTYVTQSMLDVVGVGYDEKVSFPITDSDIRRWAIAIYYPERPPERFIVAPGSVTVRMPAPEEFNPFAWATAQPSEPPYDLADPDFIELSLGLPALGLPNQLNGGVSVDYFTPMHSGDMISSSTRVLEYREKTGRLGLMLFATTETTWRNQDDDLVKRHQFTLIRYA